MLQLVPRVQFRGHRRQPHQVDLCVGHRVGCVPWRRRHVSLHSTCHVSSDDRPNRSIGCCGFSALCHASCATPVTLCAAALQARSVCSTRTARISARISARFGRPTGCVRTQWWLLVCACVSKRAVIVRGLQGGRVKKVTLADGRSSVLLVSDTKPSALSLTRGTVSTHMGYSEYSHGVLGARWRTGGAVSCW